MTYCRKLPLGPLIKDVLKARGHLCLPILFLLYMLFFSGTTIIYAVFWSIIVTIIYAQLKKETRMKARDVLAQQNESWDEHLLPEKAPQQCKIP